MTGIGETVNLFPVDLKHRDSRETKLPFLSRDQESTVAIWRHRFSNRCHLTMWETYFSLLTNRWNLSQGEDPSDRDLWTLTCFTVLYVICFYVFRGKLNTETGFHHSYQVAKYLVLSGLCIPRGWYPSRASHIFFASNFFEARWHRPAKDIIILLVSVRNFQTQVHWS